MFLSRPRDHPHQISNPMRFNRHACYPRPHTIGRTNALPVPHHLQNFPTTPENSEANATKPVRSTLAPTTDGRTAPAPHDQPRLPTTPLIPVPLQWQEEVNWIVTCAWECWNLSLWENPSSGGTRWSLVWLPIDFQPPNAHATRTRATPSRHSICYRKTVFDAWNGYSPSKNKVYR